MFSALIHTINEAHKHTDTCSLTCALCIQPCSQLHAVNIFLWAYTHIHTHTHTHIYTHTEEVPMYTQILRCMPYVHVCMRVKCTNTQSLIFNWVSCCYLCVHMVWVVNAQKQNTLVTQAELTSMCSQSCKIHIWFRISCHISRQTNRLNCLLLVVSGEDEFQCSLDKVACEIFCLK